MKHGILYKSDEVFHYHGTFESKEGQMQLYEWTFKHLTTSLLNHVLT
ncbi:MAG: hypothetical protein LLF75_01075 [Eubacteriales bacterium]|nr:hypothetical protein [Eubacteriales bacterium]